MSGLGGFFLRIGVALAELRKQHRVKDGYLQEEYCEDCGRNRMFLVARQSSGDPGLVVRRHWCSVCSYSHTTWTLEEAEQ